MLHMRRQRTGRDASRKAHKEDVRQAGEGLHQSHKRVKQKTNSGVSKVPQADPRWTVRRYKSERLGL